MRRRCNNVASHGIRYLTDQELIQPILVLEAFFEEQDMAEFRAELRLLFTLSCSDQEYRLKKQFEPSAMVDLHQQMMRLLEAAYVVYQQEQLVVNNRNNGYGILYSLFDFMTLSEWQDEMDMLLYYSLDNTPVSEDCDNHHLYFPMYELLDDLLENCECIYKEEVTELLVDVLPEGVVISNRDDDYFPPELILSLYEFANAHEDLIYEPPTVKEKLLSPAFQQQLLRYLQDFPPATTTAGLKKIYLNYLKHLLKHNDFHKDDNGSFVAHMDRLFALLQAAEKEIGYLN